MIHAFVVGENYKLLTILGVIMYIENKIEIIINDSEFCEQTGLKPFFIRSISIKPRNQYHIDSTMNLLAIQLKNWFFKQQMKR